ncbi:MAG: substrate-binding domain-containing protein [Planctomycetota bacterium]
MQVARQIAIALEIDQPYPQHQEVFAGVQRYAREQKDWQCLIDEHPLDQYQARGRDGDSYDGVIARASAAMQRRLQRQSIPFVNVLFQSAREGSPGVYPDAERLGRAAADHLLERGFRSLCYMGELDLHKHTAAVGSSFKAHAEDGGADCELLQLPDASFLDAKIYREVEKRIRQWIERLTPPVALFVEEAPIARRVIQQCVSAGLDVPRDVAVLSQHNLKSVVNVSPQISSIEIDNERAGYEAARLLDKLMSGKRAPTKPILIPPKGVVGRESTDYFAVEDALVAEALRYIASRLSEPLRVEDVADDLAVSLRTLQARFGEALGVGVGQEIRRLRLEKAKRLLLEPDYSIAHVSEQSGFGRPQLFSAVFRREVGMTPSAYRKASIGGHESV